MRLTYAITGMKRCKVNFSKGPVVVNCIDHRIHVMICYGKALVVGSTCSAVSKLFGLVFSSTQLIQIYDNLRLCSFNGDFRKDELFNLSG